MQHSSLFMIILSVLLHTGLGGASNSSSSVGRAAPPCLGRVCRPGRECRQVEGRGHVCVCRDTCPPHWKPVCGSDGVSYDNHCFLHKAACDSGKHISPTHSGFCSGDRESVLARQEFIQQLSLWDQQTETVTSKQVPIPDACFENDRNRLREYFISWMSLTAKKQPWYTAGMGGAEEVWGHFYSADTDRDLAVTSQEWSSHTNTSSQATRSARMRQLCIGRLIEEGDNDGDDKLDFEEFRVFMDQDYTPSSQVCDFDGIKFADGAERVIDCNGCVCACGKWTCTSEICIEGYRDIENRVHDDEDDWGDEDAEDPEGDPDVQDIRWF